MEAPLRAATCSPGANVPHACHGGPRWAGMLLRCSQLSVRRALPMLGSPTLRPIAFHLPELRPTPATSTRRLLRQATGCMHVPVTPGRRLNMGILQHKMQAPDYKEIPLEAGPSQEARHAAGMDVHRSPGATCSHATDTSTRLPCNATSSLNIIKPAKEAHAVPEVRTGKACHRCSGRSPCWALQRCGPSRVASRSSDVFKKQGPTLWPIASRLPEQRLFQEQGRGRSRPPRHDNQDEPSRSPHLHF